MALVGGGALAFASVVVFGGLVGLGACSRPARESPGTRAVPPLASSSSAAAAPSVSSSASASLTAPSPTPPACGDAGDVFVFTSPEHPVRGHPLRVVAVADHAIDARLTVTGAGASTSTEERHGGPPYFWFERVEAPASGKWTATLSQSEACGSADL